MWFLWILMINFIISPSHQTDSRYMNPYGDQFINDVQNFTFHTKINGDKYVITSLSGSPVKEKVEDDKQRVDKFDKEFPIRAFHIAYPSRNPIKFEMEIDEKHRVNCLLTTAFQLPCLCYDDNLPPEDVQNRYGYSTDDVIYYCGTQQSMICFDAQREVVSSNPTILKSPEKFEDDYEPFYSKVGTFIGKSRPVKFTFTIYNNNSAHVSTSDGQNPGPFKVHGFNFTEGYIDQDSTKYKMITVLPFQIFNPLCQVKWTFYGKSVQHLNPTVEFHATHDDKEYFVADKRTRFSKVKIDKKPKNDTINGNDTIPSSDASATEFKTKMSFIIGLFFYYTLFLYI